MTRVLVTGARGFIGRHALPALSERGFEVHAITSRPPPPGGDVRWHQADLLEPASASAVVNLVRPTHLLHFAWFAEPGAFWTSELNERWVTASDDLLRAFAAAGGERAVFAGSCAEYDWGHGRCAEYETPLTPSTLYGRCKLELSQRADRIAADAGVSLAWGRIFFVFGPGEHPDRLVPSVVLSLLAGGTAEVTAGTQVRDFLYVEDLARAFVALLSGSVEGLVNIAAGEGVTIRSLVEKAAAAVGRPQAVRFGALPTRPGDPPELVAETARLRGEVGWQPDVPLDEAVRRTVAWWRSPEGEAQVRRS